MIIKTNKKILFLVSGLCIILVVAASSIRFISSTALAQSSGSSSNYEYFGGKITEVYYCTCYYDPGVMITLDDYKTNSSIKVFYSPLKSLLRANYNVWQAGPIILGAYINTPYDCKDTVHVSCKTHDTTKGRIDGKMDSSYPMGVGTTAN